MFKFKMPSPIWAPNDPPGGGGAPPADEGNTPPVPAPSAGGEPSAEPTSLIGGEPSPQSAPDPLAPLENFEGLLPEGFEMPEERAEEVLTLVNGATNRAELVKGLLDLHAKEISAMQQQIADGWNTTQAAWKTELEADPTYGGQKLEASLATAKEMAMQLGGPELVKVLNYTGAGNSVHVLRALMKASELIPREARPSNGAPAVAPKTLAERMFPSA